MSAIDDFIETAVPETAAADASTADRPQRAGRRSDALKIVFGKTAQTILLVAVFLTIPLFVPRFASRLSVKGQTYREMLPSPRELVSFKGSETAPAAAEMPGTPAATEETQSAATDVVGAGPALTARDIEDPARALEPFYAALARTDAKQPGAITRITHYGDSPITNDGITAPARRLLQERFGDAGHGFILIDRPWAWYGHQAITFTSGGGWTNDSLMNPGTGDGDFGLGGVSFRATGAGKYARFAPAADGDTGKNFSRMEVYYLRQPDGGQFSASVNGGGAQTVSTKGDAVESGFYEVKATPNAANTFEIRTVAGGVRLFGAVLENEGPGVVYDSLGVNGAYAGLLATVMDEQHWAAQLQHRRPDLVIINYGTNESQYASEKQMARYDQDLREVIRRVRAALPEASLLVVSPMDRGTRAGGRVVTLASIPKIVEMQRRVALESGCAFFNLFEAMGGEGTMAKWHEGKKHLVGADLTHPNGEGAEMVGALIYRAIADGYDRYKTRTDAGKPQNIARN
ncbi:MAG TPA: GDSL-type esterase/lipase family protein [Pyrinomonadaceae bacterium]|jgi:lysophospholipase L1-like esterase